MDDDEPVQLPIKLWLDAHLHHLTIKGTPFTVIQSGAYDGASIVLKLYATRDECQLFMRQRNLMSGKMGWIHATGQEVLEEPAADAYIQRAISRDPDLWVIEVEDRDLNNPFEGQII